METLRNGRSREHGGHVIVFVLSNRVVILHVINQLLSVSKKSFSFAMEYLKDRRVNRHLYRKHIPVSLDFGNKIEVCGLSSKHTCQAYSIYTK